MQEEVPDEIVVEAAIDHVSAATARWLLPRYEDAWETRVSRIPGEHSPLERLQAALAKATEPPLGTRVSEASIPLIGATGLTLVGGLPPELTLPSAALAVGANDVRLSRKPRRRAQESSVARAVLIGTAAHLKELTSRPVAIPRVSASGLELLRTLDVRTLTNLSQVKEKAIELRDLTEGTFLEALGGNHRFRHEFGCGSFRSTAEGIRALPAAIDVLVAQEVHSVVTMADISPGGLGIG